MKRRVVIASFFVFLLLLLVAFGLFKKGVLQSFLHKIIPFPQSGIVKPAEELNQKDRLIAEIKTLALEENLSLAGEPVAPGQMLVATWGGQTTTIFSLEKEVKPQLSSLQFILRWAK